MSVTEVGFLRIKKNSPEQDKDTTDPDLHTLLLDKRHSKVTHEQQMATQLVKQDRQ